MNVSQTILIIIINTWSWSRPSGSHGRAMPGLLAVAKGNWYGYDMNYEIKPFLDAYPE